jgi:hypothetical protein
VTDSLDRNVVLAGAMLCVLIAVPAAVTQGILADDDAGTDQSAWVYLALAVIVIAYLLGGALAGRQVPSSPFVNGAAATTLAFVVVQSAGAIVRLVRGDSFPSLTGIVFNALLAASIGALGAGWASRRATMVSDGELPG